MSLSVINPVNRTISGEIADGKLPEAATRNACKLCSPLGAALVFKGIQGCLPFLHGSQGCATYIRRYLISHFREPVDIASSSFSEEDAIFGGAKNFADGVQNVIRQYNPELIGVATTCLSETIGENMIGMITDYKEKSGISGTPMVHVSTPAYTGTHSNGYYDAINAVVRQFATDEGLRDARRINVFPSMVSCADLRHLREICEAYGLVPTILPDFSSTLEGETWDAYHRISPGGTTLDDIRKMGSASASLEMGHMPAYAENSAARSLESTYRVARHAIAWPLGLRLSDLFYTTLSTLSGNRMPKLFSAERGRLVDAYVDGHKYLSGKKAAIFGEPDLVIGLAAFLSEIGIRPVICATGSKISKWSELLSAEVEDGIADIECLSGADHARISDRARVLKPDFLIGSSKGFPLAKELGIPLLRVGFPIHDRFGAQRQNTIGYRGTQELFDRIVNLVMESKQLNSKSGYSYI
jgi:nitrogenase molybdenum-iron protein NifN